MKLTPPGQRRARPAFPTVDQIRTMPIQHRFIIPAEWRDRNGHVNVQFYLTLYDLGSYQILEDINITEAYLAERHFSIFDLEHHLCFRSEMLVGDKISGYQRILAINEKRFHGIYFIVNDTRDKLACTVEYITAGIDLKTRRTAPFPEALKTGIDTLLLQHQALDWPAPVCGAMNL